MGAAKTSENIDTSAEGADFKTREKEKPDDPSKRAFILGGMAFGAAAAGVAIDAATGGKISAKLLDKGIGALEVTASHLMSGSEKKGISIKKVEREAVQETKSYVAEGLYVEDSKGEKFHAVLFTFSPKAKFEIAEIPSGKREDLLKSYEVVGPAGYLTGQYSRAGNTENISPTIGMMYPCRSSTGREFGPKELVNRFPGLSNAMNEPSGGLVVENGKLKLVGKSELEKAKNSNLAFMQMPYYLDQTNYEEVLDKKWQHHGGEFRIGDTVYWWGAYIEYSMGGEKYTGNIVIDNEMGSIHDLVEVVKDLSDDGQFKIALTDGGSGATVLARGGDLKDRAYGAGKFNTHLTPVGVTVN